MALNVEITWDGPITVGMLEDFLAQAKAGGARPDTAVEEVTHDQDPGIILGWRVPVGSFGGSVTEVPMPHRLMWNVHSMLNQLATEDGDARAHLGEINVLAGELWEALMKHVDGS
ncbi:hypothetical protein ADK53_05005 [Streptomyces sp. WM6373]|uniref:hypothetical protein n=1 Tax=unclassified Streptomyces TaxID=2593676 RepID=UPI0006AED1D5|nr:MULTISPECIES: hypothetical protein [unclassified Streptomyces]KOU43670.1 hypothetical protein ADK53_05005 [Streptomyces sp. WM6373]KOU88045.1 hypothetical protein ADK61_03575 [Streptomyces sp. XY66]